MKALKYIMNAPQIITPKKHIILLSHMRAYTSLLGHIYGSNPEIEGYYEMHTGYYSWKSRYKVKMMYYQAHKPKRDASFFFDKVLHNEHWISPNILRADYLYPMISLRDPETTIPSIVAHYQRVNPAHEYNSVCFATRYYKERLAYLVKLAKNISSRYFYFDAVAIKTRTDQTLAEMTHFLSLKSPLTPTYEKMKKTGTRYSGDSSSELFTGAIQKQKKSVDENAQQIYVGDDTIKLYQQFRNELIHNAKISVLAY